MLKFLQKSKSFNERPSSDKALFRRTQSSTNLKATYYIPLINVTIDIKNKELPKEVSKFQIFKKLRDAIAAIHDEEVKTLGNVMTKIAKIRVDVNTQATLKKTTDAFITLEEKSKSLVNILDFMDITLAKMIAFVDIAELIAFLKDSLSENDQAHINQLAQSTMSNEEKLTTIYIWLLNKASEDTLRSSLKPLSDQYHKLFFDLPKPVNKDRELLNEQEKTVVTDEMQLMHDEFLFNKELVTATLEFIDSVSTYKAKENKIETASSSLCQNSRTQSLPYLSSSFEGNHLNSIYHANGLPKKNTSSSQQIGEEKEVPRYT